MEAFWHRDLSPHGFYDFGQHIAILPTLFPRPSVAVDHEITHVSIINNSTTGLLQQLAACAFELGWDLQDQTIIDRSRAISGALARNIVEAHEAVAWFGTELTTQGAEYVRAPPQYRRGAKLLRDMFLRLGEQTPHDEEFDFGRVMSIADAIGVAAMSPPMVGELIERPDLAGLSQLDRRFREDQNAPMKRLEGLCSQIGAAGFQVASAWAKWVFDTTDDKRSPPVLPRQRRWLTRSVTPKISIKPAWTSPKNRALLGVLCNGTLSDTELEAAWRRHVALRTFSNQIDRYAQCCLVERPRLQRPLELEFDRATEYFHTRKWVVVSHDSVGEGFEPSLPKHGGRIRISVGRTKDDPEAEFAVYTITDAGRARIFLESFARAGKAIVAQSTGYDFGSGDLVGVRVVAGLPHAVMAVIDFRSLWTKVAMLNNDGLAGDHEVHCSFVPSREHPEEFGFMLLRGAKALQPVVVVTPVLIRMIDRMLSAREILKSPSGTHLARPTDEGFEVFTRNCERSVYAALMSFSESFEQPDLDPRSLRIAQSDSEWGLPIREKLRRAALQ